jgi:hypothetical protein
LAFRLEAKLHGGKPNRDLEPFKRGLNLSQLAVTFFLRAASYQELKRRFVREKRLAVTGTQFHHGLLAGRPEELSSEARAFTQRLDRLAAQHPQRPRRRTRHGSSERAGYGAGDGAYTDSFAAVPDQVHRRQGLLGTAVLLGEGDVSFVGFHADLPAGA